MTWCTNDLTVHIHIFRSRWSFIWEYFFPMSTLKTNRTVSTKLTYHKERRFFREFCFSLRTSLKELIWCINDPNVHIRTFCKRRSFIWRCFFPVSSILNSVLIDAICFSWYYYLPFSFLANYFSCLYYVFFAFFYLNLLFLHADFIIVTQSLSYFLKWWCGY